MRLYLLRCLLIILIIAVLGGSVEFPDFARIHSQANELNKKVVDFADKTTQRENMTQKYREAIKDVKLEPVDGHELVKNMAANLENLFGKRLDALTEAVEWAEKLAEKHEWNNTFKKDDVPYMAAKGRNGIPLNNTAPPFEYSEKFKQNVNFNRSSVHIPVEIYEGDIDILNGLAWTDKLDKVWKENYEKDSSLLWQYFGSQTGFARTYPGSKWRMKPEEVDLYDVRRRPWYTQGASSAKDMLILIDTSGSTHGQALKLMKQAAISLLETLGENDFVQVARFSDDARNVACFDTFVQANFRHKKVFIRAINDLQANGMAKYSVAMEFAFKQFERFEEKRERMGKGQGAACNPIIMMLTDGGTETPQDIFEKYNWNKTVTPTRIYKRIFTYAVGPTANPIAAVKWIACSNRGYFAKIRSMGAIRSTVQNYNRFLGYGLNSSVSLDQWTSLYVDQGGLGMMVTVTLPVYNRSTDQTNQTILGVMGTDVTIGELEQFTETRKLGPNGYAFALNNNGYLIFHPNLKAQKGWLADPPNVDFVEVEYNNTEKLELRQQMIDGASYNGTWMASIKTHVNLPDQLHTDYVTRNYYYTSIKQTSFSLGIVLPDYQKNYISGINLPVRDDNSTKTRVRRDTGKTPDTVNITDIVNSTDAASKTDMVTRPDMGNVTDIGNMTDMGNMTDIGKETVIETYGNNGTNTSSVTLDANYTEMTTEMTTEMVTTEMTTIMTTEPPLESLSTETSGILLAPWKFCANRTFNNESSILSDLEEAIDANYEDCDQLNIQHLLWDAKVTELAVGYWKNQSKQERKNDMLPEDVKADVLSADVESRFMGTMGGLTRVFPKEYLEEYEDMADTWGSTYFKRALDNKDLWMFHAPYTKEERKRDRNETAPSIMVTRAIHLDGYSYTPAVIGVRVNQSALRRMMKDNIKVCDEPDFVCYLVDDGGFLIVSSEEEDDLKAGMWFWKLESVLMNFITQQEKNETRKKVFRMKEEYDYQASCPVMSKEVSAGIRSLMLPQIFEMLTLKWWTTKLAWAYLNFNIYNWLFASPEETGAYAKTHSLGYNESCILHQAQYHFNRSAEEDLDSKDSFQCGNCTREFARALLKGTNLLVIITRPDCSGTYSCAERTTPLLHTAEKVEDPSFTGTVVVNGKEQPKCQPSQLYRKRTQCSDYNPYEDSQHCGVGCIHCSTRTAVVTRLLLLLVTASLLYML